MKNKSLFNELIIPEIVASFNDISLVRYDILAPRKYKLPKSLDFSEIFALQQM